MYFDSTAMHSYRVKDEQLFAPTIIQKLIQIFDQFGRQIECIVFIYIDDN